MCSLYFAHYSLLASFDRTKKAVRSVFDRKYEMISFRMQRTDKKKSSRSFLIPALAAFHLLFVSMFLFALSHSCFFHYFSS